MDIYLHFFISLGLTTLLLVVLMLYFPAMQKRSPRFWKSERRLRRSYVTLAISFGFFAIVTLGIVKEWIDAYGWGNVEFLDLFADVAGVLAGIALVLKVMRRESRSKVRKARHSRADANRGHPVNFFRPIKTMNTKREIENSSDSQNENG